MLNIPVTSLVKLLCVVVALVGIRVLAFKLFKPSVEQPVPQVEATTARMGEETLPPVSVWPVVVLVCVIATLVVSLVVFGNAING